MRFDFNGISLCSALALSLVCGAAFVPQVVQAEENFNLRFTTYLPVNIAAVERFATIWSDSIREASGGSIQVTMFPSGQLGNAVDHYDMIRDGIADIGWVTPSYQPGRFPIIAAAELPFATGSDATAVSYALTDWYADYAKDEMADVKYCFLFGQDPGGFHFTNKKVTKPEDLNGLKVRAVNGLLARYFGAFGATNVQAAASEAREVLSKGIVDGITFPWNSVFAFGFQDTVKYHLESDMYTSINAVLINKSVYGRMSDAQKKVMDDHCGGEWIEKVVDPWTEWEHSGRDKMRALEGHEVYSLTDAETLLWQQAATPLYEEWRKMVTAKGHNPAQVSENLTAALEKYSAAPRVLTGN